MAEFLSPSIYVEEVPGGPAPILGVSTSSAGIVGVCKKGPVRKATLVTSFEQYQRIFGGLEPNRNMGYMVAAFFANGGARAWINRLLGAGNAKATVNIVEGVSIIWIIDASSEGVWANYNAGPPEVGVRVNIIRNLNYAPLGTGPTYNYYIFDVQVLENGEVVEQFNAVDFKNDTASNFVTNVINNNSQYVKFTKGAGWTNAQWINNNLKDGVLNEDKNEIFNLAGGSDGASVTTISASDLAVFDEPDEIMQIFAPDFPDDSTVAINMIDYAEKTKDKFVILAAPNDPTITNVVNYVRATLNKNTSYAGIYYPWVKVPDPLIDNKPRVLAPMGHIAGIYARTDTNKNVAKAPGGIDDGALRFVLELTKKLTKGERDILYQARINPLIDSPQTGRAVWGVRTLSLDANWRYINVRRLFTFLEKAIYNGMFFAVFENNGPSLWARIKLTIGGFLFNLFEQGYFAGRTAKEAFFIICDESNNPPEAIESGLLTVDVGIAANKPAEFIRIRFQQKVKTIAT